MSLNFYQKVYGISFTSSNISAFTGTTKNLQTLYEECVQHALNVDPTDKWAVTWGPVVWKAEKYVNDPKTGVDNAWFAATCDSFTFPDGSVHKTCIIAIAGTATHAATSWSQEDFAITTVVDWNSWVDGWNAGAAVSPPTAAHKPDSSKPYISFGSARGVYILMSQTPPPGTASAGDSLAKYLSSLPADTKIIITGHSLGGALSPALALGLVQGVQLRSNDFCICASAGASPGNSVFSSLFHNNFPISGSSGYQTFNCDLFNTLDIVPQAWSVNSSVSPDRNLNNIPGLYGKPHFSIELAVMVEKHRANKSHITYNPIQGSQFTPSPIPPAPSGLKEWANQAIYQHTKAYSDAIGLKAPQLTSLVGIRLKTVAQRAADFPVLRNLAFEIAAEGGDDQETNEL